MCDKNEHITRIDLEKVAIENDIQHYKTLIDQVIAAANHFPEYAKELDIPDDLISAIKNEFIQL